MVAAKDLRMDDGIVQTVSQTVGDDKVVDAPASITLTGLETVGPPRIFHFIGIFITESVSKSASQQIGELFTLLVCEASIATVGRGILNVYLLMGHVQVATEDDGFLLVEAFQIGTEGILPRHAILKTFQTVLRVWRITANKEKVLHLERDDTPLMVVQVDADAIIDAEWLVLVLDGRTRVAFLIGIVPERLITLKREIELSSLHLRLLKTEEVGIKLTEYLTEALGLASP